MPRQIEPYWQGELDSLCGIHAIINALYLLLPDMKEREAQRLFDSLLEEVGRTRSDPLRITWKGMDPSLFRHLTVYAVEKTSRRRSVPLQVSRPFAKGRANLDTLVQGLREHASAGGVALISMRGKSSHWTVVKRVGKKKLHLFDSVGLQRMRIKECALSSGKRYRIHAGETMLLKKLPQE